MTTTAQNTNFLFTQFPSKEIPRKCTVSGDLWANRYSAQWINTKCIQKISQNRKYIYIYIYIYFLFFIIFFRYIAERWCIQMKPTWAMYFLRSLQGHSLGFHGLILFLYLFNELNLPTEYHSESSLRFLS